jgi:hypothetical protein
VVGRGEVSQREVRGTMQCRGTRKWGCFFFFFFFEFGMVALVNVAATDAQAGMGMFR